jgi:hypothetical protein
VDAKLTPGQAIGRLIDTEYQLKADKRIAIAALIESLVADAEEIRTTISNAVRQHLVRFKPCFGCGCKVKGSVYYEHSPDCWVNAVLNAGKPNADNTANLKDLSYSFLSLSYVTRVVILNKFDLVEPEDAEARHTDILQKIIDKAKANGCLEDFWQEVRLRSGKDGE